MIADDGTSDSAHALRGGPSSRLDGGLPWPIRQELGSTKLSGALAALRAYLVLPASITKRLRAQHIAVVRAI